MGQKPPRMTLSTQLVLDVLLQDPGQEMYGAEIGSAAGLASGTVHPILARLEGMAWVESRWEHIDPSAAGRPPRRYYTITPHGVTSARAAMARLGHARLGQLRLRPGENG